MYATLLGDWEALDNRFSTFLTVRPSNAVPHVVVTPSHKIIFVAISFKN